MIAVSSAQVSMAVDFDQDSHDISCQHSNMDSHSTNIVNMDEDCAMNHEEHCQNHVSCVGHSTSLFQISNQTLFTARNAVALKFTVNDESIQAHYPDLLKRPPKS